MRSKYCDYGPGQCKMADEGTCKTKPTLCMREFRPVAAATVRFMGTHAPRQQRGHPLGMRENAGDPNPGHAVELPGFPVPRAKLAWTILLMLATRNRVGRIVPEYAKANNEQGGVS